jgi:hypothetical protein
LSEIKIQVSPETSEPETETEITEALDVAEVEAIVADAIEDAQQEIELDQAQDDIETLKAQVMVLAAEVDRLNATQAVMVNDIVEDDARDAQNNVEHELLQTEVEAVAAEVEEPGESMVLGESPETEDDVPPPHAEQHILFAPAPTVWAKFKEWYNN